VSGLSCGWGVVTGKSLFFASLIGGKGTLACLQVWENSGRAWIEKNSPCFPTGCVVGISKISFAGGRKSSSNPVDHLMTS
jgi:hypothetical protein